MPWESLSIRAPHLAPGEWINTPPLTMEELISGGLALVDVWDYSCLNCVRTLPYRVAWHERYAPLGLRLLGIHTPEFAFARQRETVAAAVERFGLPYPVLLDNEQANWHAFAARAWPSTYLIDAQRLIRFTTVGEGHYAETEAAIQQLLRERHGEELHLPPLLPPLHPTDAPGAACYPATPELYVGPAAARPASLAPDAEGALSFAGSWRAAGEFAESGDGRCTLRVPYRAAEIHAVLATVDGEPRRLFLEFDGQPLPLDEAGEDVTVDSDLGSYVLVRAPRLYSLALAPDAALRTLTLESHIPGLRVYSFSFVPCPC